MSEEHSSDCPFCDIPSDRVLEANELCLAFRDLYPVSDMHTLIIPRRHARTYFDLSAEEVEAVHALLHSQREAIQQEDSSVEGFNVGINCEATAGQTVFHCHVHLIPRRGGDVEDPTGGVRNVFPGKGKY
jgi:ATP adenylyltransferase